jgi:hypothetical protein
LYTNIIWVLSAKSQKTPGANLLTEGRRPFGPFGAFEKKREEKNDQALNFAKPSIHRNNEKMESGRSTQPGQSASKGKIGVRAGHSGSCLSDVGSRRKAG